MTASKFVPLRGDRVRWTGWGDDDGITVASVDLANNELIDTDGQRWWLREPSDNYWVRLEP